jgi:hypothetical protein
MPWVQKQGYRQMGTVDFSGKDRLREGKGL